MSETPFHSAQQPQLHYVTPATQPSKYTREEVVPGVVLENYVKRIPSDDNTYVLVSTHSERIEKIKQPDEIAAEKRAARIGAAIFGTIAAGFIGLMGYIAYKDSVVAEGEAAKDELRRIQADNERLKDMQES